MPKVLIVKLLLLVVIGAGLGAIAQATLFPGKAPAVLFRQPGWSLLSDNERKILQPLADKWVSMGITQQEKWRAIAKKYPSLSPREQQKIQRRMTRWAGIAPEQRAVARKKYQTFKKKKPEEQDRVRSAWQSHQDAKGRDDTASATASNESALGNRAVAKETETTPSVKQPSSGPTNEGLRSENQE